MAGEASLHDAITHALIETIIVVTRHIPVATIDI